MHRIAERDTDRDRDHLHRRAQRVLPRVSAGQMRQQPADHSRAPSWGTRWPWSSHSTRSALAAAASECVTSTPAACAAVDLAREQSQDDIGGVRIEVAGRLVGKHERGRCTSARATATRCSSPPESSRGMLGLAAGQPDFAEQRGSARVPLVGRDAEQDQRQRDVCTTVRCGRMWNA